MERKIPQDGRETTPTYLHIDKAVKDRVLAFAKQTRRRQAQAWEHLAERGLEAENFQPDPPEAA